MQTQSEDVHVFSRNFDFKPHALINFVGGGGKTALILKLMEELIGQGHVLYTTTTRIHPPNTDKNMVILSGDNLELLKMLVEQTARLCSDRNYKIVATRHFMEPDLLNGVPADFLEHSDRSLCALFLNEADGSARFSIKLPREGEPVLMSRAEYLVPVIGLDCLHRTAGPDTLFRFQTQSSRFSIRAGERITTEMAAKILLHPKGVCKDWEKGARIIPFINKVDTPEQDADARELASLLLRNENFPISHVVWGSVLNGRGGCIAGS